MRKPDARDGKPAHAVRKSGNVKTGPVNVTYVGKGSCPDECLHKILGTCYGEDFLVNLTWDRLESEATPAEYSASHAAEIDSLPADRPLRLRVVGDVLTAEAAEEEARAAADYQARGRAAGADSWVWSYTHCWQEGGELSEILPEIYYNRGVSVLASCETLEEVRQASQAGWACAASVPAHPADGKPTKVDGFKLLPCPAQTQDNVNCMDCGLCGRAEFLRDTKTVITFAAHGRKSKQLAQALPGVVDS